MATNSLIYSDTLVCFRMDPFSSHFQPPLALGCLNGLTKDKDHHQVAPKCATRPSPETSSDLPRWQHSLSPIIPSYQGLVTKPTSIQTLSPYLSNKQSILAIDLCKQSLARVQTTLLHHHTSYVHALSPTQHETAFPGTPS